MAEIDDVCRDHEKRISTLEQSDRTIIETLKGQEKRIDDVEATIGELRDMNHDQNKALALIQKDITHIVMTTQKSDDKLDKLYEKRIDDRYIDPLNRYEKLKEKIIGAVIGVLVVGVLAFLFPMLGR